MGGGSSQGAQPFCQSHQGWATGCRWCRSASGRPPLYDVRHRRRYERQDKSTDAAQSGRCFHRSAIYNQSITSYTSCFHKSTKSGRPGSVVPPSSIACSSSPHPKVYGVGESSRVTDPSVASIKQLATRCGPLFSFS